MTDPFAAHPELAAQITPAEASSFRDFSIPKLEAMLVANGLPTGWWHGAETIASSRTVALAGVTGDLWVFAYGSLMWDPALRFAEVRRAYAPHHARRFILRDVYGGRGTADSPGLMAALDEGPGCHGLAYRIAAEDVDTETEILWRREMLAPCYLARFIPVEIGGEPQTALAFIADHSAELIAPNLTRDEQVDYLVTGKGFLGTSFDYLLNIARHLHEMGIPDADLDALLADARARRDAEAQ